MLSGEFYQLEIFRGGQVLLVEVGYATRFVASTWTRVDIGTGMVEHRIPGVKVMLRESEPVSFQEVGNTHREIADQFGIGRARVFFHEREALKKLRRAMERVGIYSPIDFDLIAIRRDGCLAPVGGSPQARSATPVFAPARMAQSHPNRIGQSRLRGSGGRRAHVSISSSSVTNRWYALPS